MKTPAIELSLDGEVFQDGKGPKPLPAGVLLTYSGLPRDGIELSLKMEKAECSIQLTDETYDALETLNIERRPASLAAAWHGDFTDSVLVRRGFTF